jgi:DNA-directed RNA polymerase specialized sigma24 family protein
MHANSSPIPSEVHWAQLRPVLDDSLHALREPERTVILQRFFQGVAMGEIAVHLQVSDSTSTCRDTSWIEGWPT